MSYTVHNFEQGDVLYANQLNEMDAQIVLNEQNIDEINARIGNYTELSENVDELKNAVEDYGTWPISNNFFARNNGTVNGVTYAWSSDGTCVVTGGTGASPSANLLYNNPSGFPAGIVPGRKYYLDYETTDTNVRFMATYYRAGGATGYYPYTASTEFTIPSDATGIAFSLHVLAGKSFATSAVVTRSSILDVDSIYRKVITLSDKTLQSGGVLASGTDLNSLHGVNKYYLLNSGYTYDHIPATSAYGCMLKVFTPTPTVTVQEFISLAPDGDNYVRLYVQGTDTWFAWSNRSSGTTYNNTYTTEHYDNTYNITCSPTITTDTNNYLASTGDNTDRTGDIQTMLNTTGVCHLGPGRFVVTGVDIPNYGLLTGSGTKTVIVLADSVTSGYAVKLKTYSRVTNTRIVGSLTSITRPAAVGTRHGVLFEGTANAPSGATTYYRSSVDNCLITDFTGGGITMYNTGLSPSSSLHVSDVFVARCGVGINIPYFSEFHRVTNVSAQECLYGCIDNGGNNNFANCDFSTNTIALLIDNSTGQSRNNTHGTFSACTFHHSDNTYSGGSIVSVGTAMRILGASNGEVFTGCQIGYGAIEIDGSRGIRFVGCNILNMVELEITDSSLVGFSDCNFWDANSSPLTQSGNTTLRFSDCYLMNGASFNPVST